MRTNGVPISFLVSDNLTADAEDTNYASPKANKRLSFKNATRKTSAFGVSDC